MLNRRTTLLGAVAVSASAAFAGRGMAQTPAGSGPSRFSALNILYRTDPERIARVLPPPLEPDDDPIVQIDFFVTTAPGGVVNVMAPEDYFETAIQLAAKYKGNRGLYQLSLGLNGEWGRSSGREGPGWVKKEGLVRLDWQDKAIDASYWRRGQHIVSLKAQATDQPAHPRLWMRDFGWGAFLFRHRLDPDWRNGLVDPEYGVELWRLGGNDEGFPTEAVADEPGVPRALDPRSVELMFPDLSLSDAWGEFPVRDIIGGSFSGHVGERLKRPPRQGSSQQTVYGARAKFVEKVDVGAFEPHAFFSYDRPTIANKPMLPPGWPATTTAWKLTAEEIQMYKARTSVTLNANAITLDGEISSDLHRQILPEGVEAGDEAIVRFLALDVTSSDISTVPFKELWLLARCRNAGAAGWYALSHIVGPGGDVLLGRETFGYPSKVGSITIATTPTGVEFSGDRLLREFVRASAEVGDAAALTTETAPVIGLAARFNRPDTDDVFRARFVVQPWSIEPAGDCRSLKNLAITLSSTPAPGRIGLPDPWFKIQPTRIKGAWAGPVRISRMPATKGGSVPDYRRFYMERMDGTQSAMAEPSTSTFRINLPPT